MMNVKKGYTMLNNCTHRSTTRVSSDVKDYFQCNSCPKQFDESQVTNLYQDYSFTYIRRGHPTQVISTRALSLDEAVDNMHYQMERFGLTKEDLRRELCQ